VQALPYLHFIQLNICGILQLLKELNILDKVWGGQSQDFTFFQVRIVDSKIFNIMGYLQPTN
jgi:hypothetical protein